MSYLRLGDRGPTIQVRGLVKQLELRKTITAGAPDGDDHAGGDRRSSLSAIAFPRTKVALARVATDEVGWNLAYRSRVRRR
jgi:hypothetical protein